MGRAKLSKKKSLKVELPDYDNDSHLKPFAYLLALKLKWAEIWESLRRKKGSGGPVIIRAPEMPPICMIVPGKLRELDRDNADLDGDIEVWSDRPLFLWQENMVGIEVRVSGKTE